MSTPIDDDLNTLIASFLGPVKQDFFLQEEYRRSSLLGFCKNILSSNYGSATLPEDLLIDQIQKNLFRKDSTAKSTLDFKTKISRIKKANLNYNYSGILQVLAEVAEINSTNKTQNVITHTTTDVLGSPYYNKNSQEYQYASHAPVNSHSPHNKNKPYSLPFQPFIQKKDDVLNPAKDGGVHLAQFIPKIDDITEDEIIRDVFYIIQGIDGKYITWSNESDGYSINSNINISNPTMYLLDRLLEVGELNNKISRYINSPITLESLVRQSFRLALINELNELSGFILKIEKQQAKVNNSVNYDVGIPKLTLRGLYVQLQQQLQKLRVLASMIESFYIDYSEINQQSSLGGEMLSKLHTFTRDGDPFIKNLANKMLKAASVPFNNILMRWITEGELEDPYREFFVVDDEENTEQDGLWSSRYNIDVSKIPIYICSDLTRKIFLTGKSLSFLRIACNDVDWITLQSPTKDLKLDLNDQNLLKKYVDDTYEKVNNRLLKVMMNDYNLMKHIAAMKKYLLLEQGDFVQCLVENLGSQLDKPASRLIHHNIMTAVESAIRSSNAQFDNLEFTERISVRLSAITGTETSGWSAFPITYHIDSPINFVISESTMLKYNELTTFLLKLKRIELHLHRLWQHQLSLKTGKKNQKNQESQENNNNNSNDRNQDTHTKYLLKKVRICCGEMMHFVHQLERYIYLNAIEGSYNKFLKSVYGKDYETNALISLLSVNTPVKDCEDKPDTNVTNSDKEPDLQYENIINPIVKPGFDLDLWITAHDNYISEVRRMVMGKKRSYINTVEHILNTINLFCISSDHLYNDLLGVGNSEKLFKKSKAETENTSASDNKSRLVALTNKINQNVSDNANLNDLGHVDYPENKTTSENTELNSPIVEKVENAISTFKRDIRNMLKLVKDGTDSIFLRGLGVSFDMNMYYTKGNGKV
ncbi:hypothetical protein BB561_003391 [Smittium simulii]|uniref:Uncharacterized protein n=1 Tax=Smittium simulii TaxID=133385 RepID=A0A2T9YLM3_9FUNG|nr:hypothetical protein BB561_003391 [Smittium simulii]